jgi:hypothetical protein
MPWKNRFDSLKKEFNAVKGEVQSGINTLTGSSQQQQQPRPLQQPHHYPPPQQQPPAGASAYWRPRFHQDTAVTAEWDAKMGNGPDGWGNQELQHYTALPQNTFQ